MQLKYNEAVDGGKDVLREPQEVDACGMKSDAVVDEGSSITPQRSLGRQRGLSVLLMRIAPPFSAYNPQERSARWLASS